MPTLVNARSFVRLAAHLGGVFAALLCLGTVSFAPWADVAEPGVEALESMASDSLATPPRSVNLAQLTVPRVRARAAIVYNPQTHEILWERNSQRPQPIASITKVMTTLVFLAEDPDLTRDVVISRADVRRSSTTYLRRGERVRLREIVHLALVGSDNVAARVLARVSPWGTKGFVAQMNRRAAEMGLHSTRFADPSGLHQGNVSTAYDVSRLISSANRHPRIAKIMRKSNHRLETSRGTRTVRNTNRLLRGNLQVLAGKTGYIDASGYCLAAFINIPGEALPTGEPVAVVVLGVGSSAGRFREVTRLADWVSRHSDALLQSPDAVRSDPTEAD